MITVEEEEQDKSAADAKKLVFGVGEFIINNYKSWTIATFFSLCRSHGLTYEQITKYYNLWVKKNLAIRRIKEVPTLEDFPMYVPTGINTTPKSKE